MIYATVSQSAPKVEGGAPQVSVNFFGDPKECETLTEKFQKEENVHIYELLAKDSFVPVGAGLFYKK